MQAARFTDDLYSPLQFCGLDYRSAPFSCGGGAHLLYGRPGPGWHLICAVNAEVRCDEY